MALIIKGKMPTSCGFCVECRGGGNEAYYCNTVKKHIADVVPPYDKRMKWCPIKGEIPNKHGRLIDADKLTEEFDGQGVFLEEEVKKIIDFFPVVVEATE